MNIDTDLEQTTQSQGEPDDKMPNTSHSGAKQALMMVVKRNNRLVAYVRFQGVSVNKIHFGNVQQVILNTRVHVSNKYI